MCVSAAPAASTPPLSERDPDEGGRGLITVAALSARHGVSRLANGGKVGRAECDTGAEVATVPQMEPTPLPCGYRRVVFSDARQPNRHAQADLALMGRITPSP